MKTSEDLTKAILAERERLAGLLDRLADDFPPDRRTAFRAAAEVVRKGAQTQERSNDKEAGHG